MSFQIALVHQFAQQQYETWELAFSPDGHRLVSSDGHAFCLWLLSPEGHWIFGQSFAIKQSAFPQFLPGGDLATLVYEDEAVRLTTLDGREKAVLPKPPPLASRKASPLLPGMCGLLRLICIGFSVMARTGRCSCGIGS